MKLLGVVCIALSSSLSSFVVAETPVKPMIDAATVDSKEMAKKSVFDHSTWSQLLTNNIVSAGASTQVDYAGMDKQSGLLQQYLDSLSNVKKADFDRWEKPDQLAFLLNAYNAWTVKLVLSDYKNIESIKDLGSIFQSPWKKSFIPLFGDEVSLDHIEHTLIRGSDRYNDPRIHFAANCASIGCPALRNEAYDGAQLDKQLEEQAQLFLSDSTRNFAKGNRVSLSSIFKWYRGDFEAGWRDTYELSEFLLLYANALSLTAAQIEALETDDMDIKFLDYDWHLNIIQP